MESSQPSEVPPPAEEISVARDGPTLHFRQYDYRELGGSSAEFVPGARLAARKARSAA